MQNHSFQRCNNYLLALSDIQSHSSIMEKKKKRIFVSDFDGTLTTKDSMFEIIVYKQGLFGLVWAMICLLPWLLLMVLKKYPKQRTKERLLYRCFKNMNEKEFQEFCFAFALENHRIIRKDLYDLLLKEKKKGTEVIVITASPEIWVRAFLPHEITVLGTRLNFENGILQPHFSGKNCRGREKVNRLLEFLPDIEKNRSEYYITAFGDSSGDASLIQFSDEGHWVRKGFEIHE